MSQYAKTTTVSVGKSQAEIREILKRYGANALSTFESDSVCGIEFAAQNRRIRFALKMPQLDEFKWTGNRRVRSASSQKKAHDQATRQRWRALALLVKAKLEAVDSGIATFEQEFLPNTILPNGQSVSEFVLPQIESAYQNGQMLAGIAGLLPEAASV